METEKLFILTNKETGQKTRCTLFKAVSITGYTLAHVKAIANGSIQNKKWSLEDYSKMTWPYKWIKRWQVEALENFGNTVIRTRHKPFRQNYIDEFKDVGLDVEITLTHDKTLLVTKKR